MKPVITRLPLAVLGAAVPLWSVAAFAQAPVILPVNPDETFALRSKWTVGEKLNYEMNLDGTVNMQMSGNTASPVAGLPLDVDVKMNGAATLDTLKVDEMGTGTVALKVDNLRILAETFGQKADFNLRDGRMIFMMNGQRMGGQNNQEPRDMTAPVALEISNRGRVLKAVPTKPAAETANAAVNNAKKPNANPLDFTKLAQAAFWSAIPALWPATPVKNGDKWSAEINWPPPAVATLANNNDATATNATAPMEPMQVGKFDFILRGPEEIGGRRVVRVAVDGRIEVDPKTAAALQKNAEDEVQKAQTKTDTKTDAAKPTAKVDAKQARQMAFRSQMNSALQKVTGDVWFDVERGQMVRAELALDTRTTAKDVAVPGVPVPPRAKADQSWLDFAGTLQLQL